MPANCYILYEQQKTEAGGAVNTNRPPDDSLGDSKEPRMGKSTRPPHVQSIPPTTDAKFNSDALPEPHPVNYVLLEPDEWIEPEFTEILHRLDSKIESLQNQLETAVQSALREGIASDEWDGQAGLGMMFWLYFRYPFIPTQMVADVFDAIPLDEHERMRVSLMERAERTIHGLRVEQLRAMPYKDYLKTEHWQRTRERALEDAGNRCQLCNADNRLHVHHKTYERRGEEMPDDLIVLCAECHQHFHNGRKVTK